MDTTFVVLIPEKGEAVDLKGSKPISLLLAPRILELVTGTLRASWVCLTPMRAPRRKQGTWGSMQTEGSNEPA